jgi:hypothetical protein
MGRIDWVGHMKLGQCGWGRKENAPTTDLGRGGAVHQDGPKGQKNKNKSGNNKWPTRDVWAELTWAKNRKGFQISDSRKQASNQKF